MDTASHRLPMACLAAFLSVLAPALRVYAAASIAPSFTVNLAPYISHAEDVATGYVDMVLTHDTPCSITVSVISSGDEILHNAGKTSTLATSYKLTGDHVQNPDASFIDAATFLGRSYSVLGAGPLDNLTLNIQATPSGLYAPDAGSYSATFALTVTW